MLNFDGRMFVQMLVKQCVMTKYIFIFSIFSHNINLEILIIDHVSCKIIKLWPVSVKIHFSQSHSLHFFKAHRGELFGLQCRKSAVTWFSPAYCQPILSLWIA